MGRHRGGDSAAERSEVRSRSRRAQWLGAIIAACKIDLPDFVHLEDCHFTRPTPGFSRGGPA
jgi:hypothetical protein